MAARRDEALDQQHVSTLVEDRASYADLSKVDRTVGVAGRQRAHHLGPDLSVDQTGDALAVHQQPGVELGTTSWVDPLEELSRRG